MNIARKKQATIVGLDVEAGSVAATEVEVNGRPRVTAAGLGSLPAGVFADGEVADADGLADALRELFAENKLSKKVRLGIANQRVIVRTLRLPAIDSPTEMEAAIKFQAQEEIPMPLDQAVLDHQVVGGVQAEAGKPAMVDVVVVAARRDMVTSFVVPLRKAGLQPVGIDLSAFGMIRALAQAPPASPDGNVQPIEAATLYCNVGDVTNLAVARGRACLFTRVAQTGFEGLIERVSAEQDLTQEHARLWLGHVGLDAPVEQVEGDAHIVAGVRAALEDAASALLRELRMSLDYYGSREGVPPVERVLLCGPGSSIPGLNERLGSGLGVPVDNGKPEALETFDEATAARLTLPYGLALDS
ncbi:MAG TPA: type IV pilus assembly protein PilM [Solirubrobacterales bacterium]|nr:type IV pilus assembly protein PilM [Solirubrobacterales bacterium]